MPKYRIVEVDPAPTPEGHIRVRVSGPGFGFGHWDRFDGVTLLCLEKPPRYLIEEARATVAAMETES